MQLSELPKPDEAAELAVETHFPGFAYETKRSLRNAIASQFAKSPNPSRYLARAMDVGPGELLALHELARSLRHTEAAEFLGAARWLPFSELDAACASKPPTRNKIFELAVAQTAAGAQKTGLAFVGALAAAGSAKPIAALGAKALAACGVAATGAGIAAGAGSVALAASLGFIGFSAFFHRIPNAVFPKMLMTKLFPLNSVSVFEDAVRLIESDPAAKESWSRAGLSSDEYILWANSISEPAKARALTKASVKESMEICALEKLAASGLADPLPAKELWRRLTDRKNISDAAGWLLVDACYCVANVWSQAGKRLEAFSSLVRHKLSKAGDFGRLGRKDDEDPTPQWLEERMRTARALPGSPPPRLP